MSSAPPNPKPKPAIKRTRHNEKQLSKTPRLMHGKKAVELLRQASEVLPSHDQDTDE